MAIFAGILTAFTFLAPKLSKTAASNCFLDFLSSAVAPKEKKKKR
jgi:hypothetical protein